MKYMKITYWRVSNVCGIIGEVKMLRREKACGLPQIRTERFANTQFQEALERVKFIDGKPNANASAYTMNRHWEAFAMLASVTVPPATDPAGCRRGCGACCIAPSISSPIPGMPLGKAAGERCIQLDERNDCRLFGQPSRPEVCGSLRPSTEMCGADQAFAMQYLQRLERLTAA